MTTPTTLLQSIQTMKNRLRHDQSLLIQLKADLSFTKPPQQNTSYTPTTLTTFPPTNIILQLRQHYECEMDSLRRSHQAELRQQSEEHSLQLQQLYSKLNNRINSQAAEMKCLEENSKHVIRNLLAENKLLGIKIEALKKEVQFYSSHFHQLGSVRTEDELSSREQRIQFGQEQGSAKQDHQYHHNYEGDREKQDEQERQSELSCINSYCTDVVDQQAIMLTIRGNQVKEMPGRYLSCKQ